MYASTRIAVVATAPAHTVAGDPHLETVTVNGQTAPVDGAGAFTTTLTLPEGRHTINIEAVDSLGLTRLRLEPPGGQPATSWPSPP